MATGNREAVQHRGRSDQSRSTVSEIREVRTEDDERGTGETGALARAGEPQASAGGDR
jgi:L-alanine-DL-glutamate epimerase-like enolase superfamily enzyme